MRVKDKKANPTKVEKKETSEGDAKDEKPEVKNGSVVVFRCFPVASARVMISSKHRLSKRQFRAVGIVTALCLLATVPLRAQTPADGTDAIRLSLTDAVQRVLQNSPRSATADARVAGAVAKLRSAGAVANPSLALAYSKGKDAGGLDEDVILSQIIELGDKRRLRVRAASGEQNALIAERAGNALTLQLEVTTSYYEALRADGDLQLARETRANAQAFVQTAETQFEAGDVARSNIVRSRIELARAQQALDAALTNQANRYAIVKSLVGMTPQNQLILTEALQYSPAAYTLPERKATAQRLRPDLTAARSLRAAREADVRAARAQGQPDLFVEARHAKLDFKTPGNSLRFGVLFPLFDWGGNRAASQSATALLTEQDAVIKETERLADLDVETAFRNYESAKRAVESFQTGRLDQAKELLDMAQTGYSRGANSYLELLDAQQVYRSERAEYARALADYNIARATLRRASGESVL